MSSGSSLVCPEKQLQLSSSALVELHHRCLKLLTSLLTTMKAVDVFALWPIFLPSAPTSPYSSSLLQLTSVVSPRLRCEVLQLFNCFLELSSTSLKHLAPTPKTTLVGFMPHFQALAISLDSSLVWINSIMDSEPLIAIKILCELANVHICVTTNRQTWQESTSKLMRRLTSDSSNDKVMLKTLNALLSIGRLQHHRSKCHFVDQSELFESIIEVAFPNHPLDLNVRYNALLTLTALIECQNEALLHRASEVIIEHLYKDAIEDNDEYILLHTLRYMRGLLGSKQSQRQRLLPALITTQLIEKCEGHQVLLICLLECVAQIDEDSLVLNLSENRRQLLMSTMQSHLSERSNVTVAALKALASLLSLSTLTVIDDGKTAENVFNECLAILKENDVKGISKSLMNTSTLALASITSADEELKKRDKGRRTLDRRTLLHYIPKLLLNNDHLSTKVNCLRMLGSLMEYDDIDQDCLQVLVKYINDDKCLTKLRWNACRAASLVLLNTKLTTDSRTEVHKMLMKALVTCDNLKVKSMAAEALINSQIVRAKDFVKVIEVVQKLEGEEMLNINSVQKSQSIDSMGCFAAHVFLNLDNMDFFTDYEQVMMAAKDTWEAVARRTSPEKASDIIRAQEKVIELLQSLDH